MICNAEITAKTKSMKGVYKNLFQQTNKHIHITHA